ncbi:MAG: trypsin-like peptidase domain-containing protein, partial [Synechococcales cyanobacterium CRU_2_2]|nr:trypsin-like peptidase domain-containing protein [Synechococcales cyanobacterium CRU_2_2]
MEAYKQAIARIYKDKDKGNSVIGAGFWVEGGYLFTCAHVVRDALGVAQAAQPVGRRIQVNFPYLNLGQKLSAEVLFYRLIQDANQPNVDIAALRLLDPLPAGVVPVKLSLSYQLGQSYSVVGFPEGHEKGIASFGQLLSDLPKGWVQLEDTKAQGLAISPGFSGAPVWSQAEGAVVGMVVARDKKQPEAKIGFMIPVRSLLKVHTELESLSLLRLLQPHTTALTASIHRAYGLAAPAGWSEAIPETLKGKLKGLQEMPKGDEAYKAIARFTALLCSPNLNPDEDLRQQLE